VLAQAPQDGSAPPAAQPNATATPASPAPYPAAAPAQAPAPAPLQAYPGPPVTYVPVGRGVREDVYRRNRNAAIVGKVLTAIAPILFMTAVVKATDEDVDNYSDSTLALAASALVIGTAGRITWAAADLKMTNRFDDNGVRIRRGAAITSTVTASLSWIPYVNFVATPATWVAGSIASARIREAHGQVGPQVALIPYSLQTKRGFSAGFTLKF
jgi:hypothetical protein